MSVLTQMLGETMYYEEKVINGVLCWRNTPQGRWERFSIEALTSALISERSQRETGSNELREELKHVAGALNSLRARVEGKLYPNSGMANGHPNAKFTERP